MDRNNRKKRSRKKNIKSKILMGSLILLLGIAVSSSLALLLDSNEPVVNTFTASEEKTSVDEERSGNNKSNVKIRNTSDTEAYIRATVAITWQDKDGNVLGQLPNIGDDYVISYNLEPQNQYSDGQWILAMDGFYYWNKPVLPSENAKEWDICTTGILISECTALNKKTINDTVYFLNVEIIGSGIQSVPTSVVTTEWNSGVSGIDSKDNETLIIKPAISAGGSGSSSAEGNE